MPGSSVGVADYLAIDVACRHFSSRISRLAIANYFSITVNALNARLRTCADRLRPFPTLVDLTVQLVHAAEKAGRLQMRPMPTGEAARALAKSSSLQPQQMFMHPIWLLSRHLLTLSPEKLEEGSAGLDEGSGALLAWFCEQEVHAKQLLPDDVETPPELEVQVDDQGRRFLKVVPVTRPEDADEVMGELPGGRKRRFDGVYLGPALRPPTAEEEALGMPVFGPEKLTADLLLANSLPTGAERRLRKEEDRPTPRPAQTDTSEAMGRTSRTDPFSSHDLLVIYISRKIRFLDWDAISWALSRYKTPVVGCLHEAKAAYEPDHDRILETMRLCCWPENSMYLISVAAHEILACKERGAWAEELEGFKQGKGFLYQLHMQRKIERLVRHIVESPDERIARRRREHMLGYTGLGIAEYGELPDRKRKLGACGVAAIATPLIAGGSDGLPKLRKRRTRAQIEEQEAEKKKAREVLKAAGLKTNGEPVVKKRLKDEAALRAATQATASAAAASITTLAAAAASAAATTTRTASPVASKPTSPANGATMPAAPEEKRRKYDLTPQDAAILEQALQRSAEGSALHALLRAKQRNSYDIKGDKVPIKQSQNTLFKVMEPRSKQPASTTPSMAIKNEKLAGFDMKLATLQQQLPFDLFQKAKQEEPNQSASEKDEERVKKGMSMSFLMN